MIGIAGGEKKCQWLMEKAGFDAVIDYKAENVSEQIALHCPDKWDIFFDNVGGDILEAPSITSIFTGGLSCAVPSPPIMPNSPNPARTI